ncbi:MAG: TOPRIM nucleotidyl transferase/hydrolase domain-containing protein [Actinomycetota bacterium]|nr:TOPRIM nucleotidyl transferase/hydrolase domain-containing protein [Actinomycetota bacterium]
MVLGVEEPPAEADIDRWADAAVTTFLPPTAPDSGEPAGTRRVDGGWAWQGRGVDNVRRRRLVTEALDGYAAGPDATVAATADALDRAASARAVVLVEGISDQMALEELARCQGRDLGAERLVVVPIGGAQAFARELRRFGPGGAGVIVAGLYDAGEEEVVRRAIATAGLGAPVTRHELEELGFFVCVKDLEDELIRAAGAATIEELLASQGDLGSFRTLQKQQVWRGRPFDEQFHRWLRAGARRNLRYARLLVRSLPPDRVPRPLTATLGAIPNHPG